MKKKILALGLTAVMAVAVFAGCGNSSSTEDTNSNNENVSTEGENSGEATLDYDKIIVGLDDTFAPMGFRDENGELTGVDVELANAVSEELGIPFEFQPIDWSMKETELNNGTVDLLWNGYTITDERKEVVSFTDPYLENRQIVVTMADSDINSIADLAGKTVAAQDMSSAVDAIEGKPEVKDTFAELVTFETNDQCLRDLEAGRSDAVVADEVLVKYYISQKGAEKYKILDEDFGEEEYGIGARKDDTALVEAINGAMDALKEDGTTKAIGEKWFGDDIIK
ncbi:amino acid ABC transporter substrate-binding protein [Tyzzerella sp. An114]|uniref:amino acid ABC transporter substrate-binding protein n=1 Tax=Tyzzerella sp. An114 TaxID=1965545 RepID=UPI000B43E79A|nr:amino acid ABC transporter substrate-binding protein [Tyzzerella sp. An114]OUQ59059.1 amino acid ABC transporter substrate-binding protein [Tyzzerella sp. An114]